MAKTKGYINRSIYSIPRAQLIWPSRVAEYHFIKNECLRLLTLFSETYLFSQHVSSPYLSRRHVIRKTN